ncbi:hypothetical protein SmJEL517_g01139 [Synchytrium microbalum]|uniref:GATA-type domain-containing protein n=1 Tax=Synchytrium microbalum TaxID=1806994 RepID=A0A507CAJ1_9FUNG|nr:uncharacterized protein SmJEL517_g01139 [Synchytrium microbalum]TPX36632.1 hypothetical protein SmJEL517_g01139 [Synchytrium microbalum]
MEEETINKIVNALKSHLKETISTELSQSAAIKDLIRAELDRNQPANLDVSGTTTGEASTSTPAATTPTSTTPTAQPSSSNLSSSMDMDGTTQQHHGQQGAQQQGHDSLEAALVLANLRTDDISSPPQHGQSAPGGINGSWPTLYTAAPRPPLPTPNTTPIAMPPPRPRYNAASVLIGAGSSKRSRTPDEDDINRSEWLRSMPGMTGVAGTDEDVKRRRTGDGNDPPTPSNSSEGDDYHYNPHTNLPPYQPPTTRRQYREEQMFTQAFTQNQFLQQFHPSNMPSQRPNGHFHNNHRYADEDHDDDYEEQGSYITEEDHEGCRCRELAQQIMACQEPHCLVPFFRTADPMIQKKPPATPSRTRASSPGSPGQKKSSPRPPIWKCDQCATTTTSQRRPGPKGRSTLCNACWTRGRKKAKAQQAKEQAENQTQVKGGNKRKGAGGKASSVGPGTAAEDEEQLLQPRIQIAIVPVSSSDSNHDLTDGEPAPMNTDGSGVTGQDTTPEPRRQQTPTPPAGTPPPRINHINAATSPMFIPSPAHSIRISPKVKNLLDPSTTDMNVDEASVIKDEE